jgi:hypothetical protein
MPNTGYGEAPLGVECAFPSPVPRLARVGQASTGLWRRMVYRFKYGLKISPAGKPFRAS